LAKPTQVTLVHIYIFSEAEIQNLESKQSYKEKGFKNYSGM